LKADPYDVKTVFSFERQLFAPLFQRPYVWDELDQWNPFWKDVRRVAKALIANPEGVKPHFLGAIVLDQIRVPIGKPDARSIVDGQQRLTTLQLLMEAVRDLCRLRPELDLQKKRMGKLIENEDVADPEDRFKLIPTNVDRPVYRAILETTCPKTLRKRMEEVCPDQRSRLADAYEYFYEEIKKWLRIDELDYIHRCECLVNAIREKMRIVVIDMDSQDDAQTIFETLNARGTPLLPSDLVKNFIFNRAHEEHKNVEQLHAAHWQQFDVDDMYWRTEIGIGRIKRARIDVFLQHYLSLKKGDEVSLSDLFKEFQMFANQVRDKGTESLLADFHRHAVNYKYFSDISPETPEGSFYRTLSAMQTTTVFPFLLGLYEAVPSVKDRVPILKDVESFLVRRMVCRMTTQSYNKLFLELVGKLTKQGAYTQSAVREFLLSQTADSLRWPDDSEFREAWIHQPLYSSITRPRLRILLRGLDAALHTKKTEAYILKKGLTVEHLLPQHWEKHWPIPRDHDEDDMAYEKRKLRRNHLLHTIGNMTLLTTSLNPVVSNGPFAKKKKEIMKHSAINLNRFLAEEDLWNEEKILERSKDLFSKAAKLWAYPKAND
jgi:uncharacterized protein with ParB-like and HNH nuclease domain